MFKTALKRIFGFAKRWTLANPPQEIIDLWGGTLTHAGERMSPTRALELPAYLAGLRAIAEDVAKLPLKLYTRLRPRGKEEIPAHPLYKLLHSSPNPEMTSIVFRQTLTQWAIGWGNGYAYIAREDRSGEPTSLWPLAPDRMSVQVGPDGRVYYECILDTGEIEIIDRENIIHIPGFTWNGIEGLSLASLAREAIGLGVAQQTAGGAFFGNGSLPSGVFEYPGAFKDEEAYKLFRRRWEETHAGPKNAFKVAILEHGMKYTPLSIPNKDSQWIEAGKFSVEQMARILRIPPHKIQHLEKATFSNIVEQGIEYVTDTLMPWLVRWEQELARKLCVDRNERLFYEHVVDGLMRGAPKERNEAYQIQRRNGVLSANDWREKENMNPIGEQGDVYIVEANMVALPAFLESPKPAPIMQGGEDEPEEKVESEAASKRRSILEIAQTHRELFRQCYTRILRLEADKVNRKSKDKAQAADWITRFYAEHDLHVRAVLALPVDALAQILWKVGGADDKVPESAFVEWVGGMARRHVARSLEDTRTMGLERACAVWSEDIENRNGRITETVDNELSLLVDMIAGECNANSKA